MQQDLNKYFQFSPFFVDSDSMSETAWDQLQYRIEQLPPSVSNLLTNFRTAEFIESLINSRGLSPVQGQAISKLICDIFLTNIYMGDMPAEISKRLGIDTNTAREIANQIVSQLFTPVLDDLKKMHSAKFPGRISQQQQTMPQQSYSSKPIAGVDLPETGGNIIDLRNQK